jgi:hypothetical protein
MFFFLLNALEEKKSQQQQQIDGNEIKRREKKIDCGWCKIAAIFKSIKEVTTAGVKFWMERNWKCK